MRLSAHILDGKSPYQVPAQQLKMQLNSLKKVFFSQGFCVVFGARHVMTFPPYVISHTVAIPASATTKEEEE